MARTNLGGGNDPATKRARTRQDYRLRAWFSVAVVIIILLALSSSALQNPQSGQSNSQERGARNAGVRPKRAAERRSGGQKRNEQANSATSAAMPENAAAETGSPILATADFDLVGLAVTVGPATQTVPKNTPTAVLTSINMPAGSDPSLVIGGLNPNYRVRGELTGPSLSQPLAVEAAIGQPLRIPALSNAGDHVIQNLRVVDTGAPGQPVVTSVTPDSCGIVVIDRLLISEVHVNELTYDQIVQSGINISDDAYQFFNFTLGLVTSSNAQQLSIPVAFPDIGVTDPRPVVGQPSMSGPGTSVPVPDVLPVMLEVEQEDGSPAPLPELPGEGPVRIPGVIVFPGRIGLLHQFFEAVVIVANGAPGGTPLVVHNLHAKVRLPDSGTPANPGDDPLRVAETQVGGRVSDLELHGLGADGRYGTADDTVSFTPGQSGQASFLLEGLKEGLHTINFDLDGTLDGLPVGPVHVHGEVPGAVLVRDASFSVTFTHPSVVRAGQEYELAMTMYNSGSRDILGAFANLARNSISGAELLGTETQRQLPTTIARGTSATVKWRLRASVTGAVTASYVKVGDDVSAGLNLVTGVGDRNVPLSPDSLILPDSVKYLPPETVEAARELLGQAWSVANAPPGALPDGVLPIDKQTVADRAVELGLAGLRVNFGEPSTVSLDTLMRDWLGELQQHPDAGFADAMRDTHAGFNYYDSIGAQFYKDLASGKSPAALHQEFANTESARSTFISALVTQASGVPVFGARLVDASGKRVGLGESATERFGELRTGGAIQLVSTDPNNNPGATLGQMLVVSNPATENWTLEINGWQTGTVDISVLMPSSGRSYRQLIFNGVQINQGGRYRVVFKPFAGGTPAFEEFSSGAFHSTGVLATLGATLSEPAPRLVGTFQATPDVVPGADKYGRLIGLLFSKPMSQTSVETFSRYQIGGGALVSNPSEQVGGPIAATGAKLNFGDRFVFVSLDGPIGPYIRRDVTMRGLTDAHGMSLAQSPTTAAINMRVSPEGIPPGAYLTGRVLSADGTPIPNAPVLYFTQECPNPAFISLPPLPKLLATRFTDAQGRYQMDYVRNGDCGSLIIKVQNPVTHSEKTLTTPVVYDGQHMVLDIVYLARGNVQGTITSGGHPMPSAFVRIVPDLDAVGSKVVQADALGHYSATDIPVGNVSVTAVGTGAASNASGLAAGTITGPGQTATINVSLQNISGIVRGRVVKLDGSPAVGTLVIAYGSIPGFHSTRSDGTLPVGYAYAGREGDFAIGNLPVGDIKLEATDYITGLVVRQTVQLTDTHPEETGVLLTLPGNGGISGRVLDEIGQYVPNAIVSAAGRAVQADVLGNYTLPNLPAGIQGVSAQDPVTHMSGTASTVVRIGETTSNVNITIFRPASISGHVYIRENGTTRPAARIKVSHDGTHQVETDSQGFYTITNVQPNADFTLRFVDVDNHLGVNLDARVAPAERLVRDATFRSGAIHGRITQPDGVTGTIAPVSLYVPVPYLQDGPFWGLLDSDHPLATQSAPDGSYSFRGLNPGVYRITSSNEFFPTRVSKGGTLAPNGDEECNLSFVNTLAGKIQGRVFQPDGETPVGAGVQVTLGGGSLADVTARTDSNGHYEFAEVFSEGGYALTATDTNTGYSNRTYISVRKNQDAIADIRLLGLGNVRVHVVDGAGNPVQSGSITLDGTNYPNAHRFAELTTEAGGTVQFDNLSEGPYAISATQNGLGGRVSATVVRGSSVDVTVQLQASGTVKGHVYMPGGAVSIGLADVELLLGGRSVGFTVTSDADEDRGSFTFLNVPAGEFTLNVLDNRTGRVGRSAGRITEQGQIADVSVELLSVGAVAGQVTANGNPVDHALVQISADGSGIRGANSQATTDPQGNYRFTGIPAGRFTVSVSNAPGGQTGSTTGMISGTVEPLPDTIANIVLEPSVTITGTVFKLGGLERSNGARVSITAGGRAFETSTNENGVYRLAFVPLGEIRVRAEAPTGYDRGEAQPVTATQGGTTLTADVVFNGTGSISGAALDNTGAPLATGTIIFTNDAWSGTPVTIGASVNAGRYEINGAPAGHFSMSLTVPNRVGVGTAAGDLAANQNLDLAVRLEDAGGVIGVVKAPDGTTPVAGVDIAATLFRPSGVMRFYTHTNTQGAWSFQNIPLGTLSISASDISSGGIARANNVALATNGQTVDLGTMLLDSTPIGVVSVEPANGATLLPTNGTVVRVTFSEPAESSTVNTSTVQLQQGSAGVGAAVTLSGDGLTATLTPTNRLTESATYKVVVQQVEDRAGLHMSSAFNSTFTTADETAPGVESITPANGATEVAADASIVVTFSEAIDRSLNLADIVKVTTLDAPDAPLAGNYELDGAGRVVQFRPTGGLTESSRFTITVNGQRDASGNTQAQATVSGFTTQDRTAPVVDPLPIDGTRVRAYRPTITATYHDNLSGIKTSSLVIMLDNINVTQGAIVTGSQATYTPATPISGGHHNLSVQVADNAGNTSALRTASFDIDDSGPAISSFTIGGVPAVDGMYVTSSLQPVFAVSYTDDTGINIASTQLLFAPQGSPLVQVPATVTATGITYQPPAYLAEGPYSVQAVITNNLGTSSTTGVINFTLDVDAPEITSVTPATGNQHGGTTVVISGARLLSTTGAAPAVSIGGNTAEVLTAVAGTPDQVTIVTPAGVPGAATIQMSTNRGTGVRVGGFTYEADPRTPFISEPDTVLLWHMDERTNGAVRINDSGPTRIVTGTAGGVSQAVPGRFAGGRSGADIQTSTSISDLYFGSSGFTVEGWVKTNAVGRTYTLFGKEDLYGFYFGPPEYAVRLLPNGNLRALLYDNSQRQWLTELPASSYHVDDNEWHYIAMVVDRTSNRLSLYVDGVERASSASPANFGALYNSGQPFHVGHWAYFEPQTTGGPQEFPGVLDEVRVSSTAHSASLVQKTYLGTEGTLGISITNTGPVNIASGTSVELALAGYNLAGAVATVTGPASAQLTAHVLSSSATQARVQIRAAADAALGDAQLVMTSSQGSATLALRVIDLARISFAVEPDTKLLWHMDETGSGVVAIRDEGLLGINGTSGGVSQAVPGRFAGGRSGADISTATSVNDLYFGSSSFTVEGWMKTDLVGRTYTLFGKEDLYGFYFGPPEYAVRLLPNGNLRALLYDNSQRQWLTELPASSYHVDDNEWHYIAMVVDRTSNRLSLYVDGVERASSASPANFGALYNSGQPFHVGHWAYFEPQTTGGPQEFPGVLDEVRVSSTAHSAARILSDLLGDSAMRVTSYNPKEVLRERAGLPSYINQLTVNGYNLDGATARLQVNGQTAAAVVSVTSSSYRQAVVTVDASPTVPLGNGQLVFSMQGQQDVAIDVRVGDQAESSGYTDTVLLWNLNETGNGPVRILDSSALGINGTAGGLSQAQPGHFNGGRSKPVIIADNDYGALYFGSSSFTAECWFKTGTLGRTYTLVGKEDLYGFFFGPPEFAIKILPTGGMRAMAYDTSQRQWKAEMAPSTYEVDDNQWHHAAMVVDRASNVMSLYVDGVERASATAPSGFGPLWNSGQQLRVGKWSYYDETTPAGGPEEFPGVLDDIRLSATAHTAEQIVANMNGVPGLRVNSYNPQEAPRNKATGETYSTLFTLNGFGLDGVSASLTRNGQPLNATAVVESSNFNQAQVRVSVNSSVATGTAQLVLTKPGLPAASVDVRLFDQSEFATGIDTRLLWHMNETGNGPVQVLDSGPLGINGTAGGLSQAQPGHFNGGRSKPVIIADNDYGALYFGSSSFTAECWFKTGTLGRTYTLVGKEDLYGFFFGPPEFAIKILPTGGMRAMAYDTSQRQWKAEFPGRTYDPTTGRWRTVVDDNQWHHAAMVVDRENNRLALYVDGVERASATAPSGFGPLWNSGQQLRVGKWSYYDETTPAGGPEEFPGVIDEVRLSSSAHTPERVLTDALGTDTARISLTQPLTVQRGSVNVPVIFKGYGLTNASVTTDQPTVAVTVTSSSLTQLNCMLSVPSGASIGALHFAVTTTGGQVFNPSLTIVDQQPFVNDPSSNSETLVLWHLDETSNGAVRINGAGDAVPTVLGGTSSSLSQAQAGRFNGGRLNANTVADASNSLYLGSSSFTVECWVKPGNIGRTYTLVGKEDSYGFFFGPPEYSLKLLPTGGVRAMAYDTSQRQWKAEMPGRLYDPATGNWQITVNDGQWHYLAMVVDRTNSRMTLYADGVERASSAMPSGFGPLWNSGQQLRVGKWSYYDETTPAGGPEEFPGALDEVRILNFARTAAQVSDTWLGTNTGGTGGAPAPAMTETKPPEPSVTPQPAMRIDAIAPGEVVRDKAAREARVTGLSLKGIDLGGVKARVMRDGEPLAAVAVQVQGNSETEAGLSVAVAPNVPLGPAELVLSKPGYKDVAVGIRVIEPSEFAPEADTVGLWHLDERDDGATHLLDASERGVNLTTSQASRVAKGRFGTGRMLARATADASSDALSNATNGFTIEGWVKTGTLERDYVLIGKETNTGQNTDFTLKALTSGALHAEVYDTNGVVWQAETPVGAGSLADNQWHAVALVVDRDAGLMSLYIDGQMRAAQPAPAGFAVVRNLGQPLEFGCFDADGQGSNGPEEFPGILDEIRISSTAHNPEKIMGDFFGHDQPQVTLVRPAAVQKQSGPIRITLSGYGLAGTKVIASQPDVAVSIISSTSTRLELSLIVPDSAAPGPILLTVTDGLGQTTAASLNLVERQTLDRRARPGAGVDGKDPEAQKGVKRKEPAIGSNAPDLSPGRSRRQAGASFSPSRATGFANLFGGLR